MKHAWLVGAILAGAQAVLALGDVAPVPELFVELDTHETRGGFGQARGLVAGELLDGTGKIGQEFRFALEPAEPSIWRLEVSENNVVGVRSVVLRSVQYPMDSMILTSKAGRVYGEVVGYSAGRRFVFHRNPGESLVTMSEAALSSGPPFACGTDTGPDDANRAMRLSENPSAAATVDVLFAYTPKAGFWANFLGGGGIENRIEFGRQTTNLALRNSRVALIINAVGVESLDYDETGSNSFVDVGRLRSPGDGFMDGVHARRNALGADLVQLFCDYGEQVMLLGNAYLPSTSLNDCSLGFGVLHVRSDHSTSSHELGHNFGCGHELGSNDGRLFPYSAAWRIPFNETFFYTIMHPRPTSDSIRIAQFSNPSVDYLDSPTGAVNANNARTIRQTMLHVAAYKGVKPDDQNGDGVVDVADWLSGTFNSILWLLGHRSCD